jgi:hypothetical protein
VQKGNVLGLMDLCETSQMARRDDGAWLYREGTVTYENPKD